MRELIDGTRPRRAAPSLQELRAHRDEILDICARHGASNVRVFGSVARGEQDAESDVDFLIDLERGRSLFDLGGVLADLEDLLGCAVDVAVADSLRERARPRILAEAVPV